MMCNAPCLPMPWARMSDTGRTLSVFSKIKQQYIRKITLQKWCVTHLVSRCHGHVCRRYWPLKFSGRKTSKSLWQLACEFESEQRVPPSHSFQNQDLRWKRVIPQKNAIWHQKWLKILIILWFQPELTWKFACKMPYAFLGLAYWKLLVVNISDIRAHGIERQGALHIIFER